VVKLKLQKLKNNLKMFCGKFNVWCPLTVRTPFQDSVTTLPGDTNQNKTREIFSYKPVPSHIQLKDFPLNNVSAPVLAIIKQIAQNNPLLSRIIPAMLSFALKTESSNDPVVFCFE
jgi:hypothetical protein